MSVCIQTQHKASTDNRPSSALLSRSTIEGIVNAIQTHTFFQGLIAYKDDHHGSYAMEVPAPLIIDIILTLPDLTEEAMLVIHRADAEKRTLNFDTNDQMAMTNKPQATISMHWEKIGEPVLDWNKFRAVDAFKAIGLKFGEGITIEAAKLKTDCEKFLMSKTSQDISLILRVANYAINSQGNEAIITAY